MKGLVDKLLSACAEYHEKHPGISCQHPNFDVFLADDGALPWSRQRTIIIGRALSKLGREPFLKLASAIIKASWGKTAAIMMRIAWSDADLWPMTEHEVMNEYHEMVREQAEGQDGGKETGRPTTAMP